MMQYKDPEDYIQKMLNDPEKVAQILQKGIRSALLKHKQAGNPVCEGRDGKVVWIPSEEIYLTPSSRDE
ncbi:MAG TPA: hypothetical protein DEA62_04175, partial [Coxiellaceae bacterium]|nr:hypothetical protein [Coxiellaceae bacterium]